MHPGLATRQLERWGARDYGSAGATLRGTMLASIPLLAVVVVIYNLVALTSPGMLDQTFFSLQLLSGADWSLRVSDAIVALGLILLYVEIVKSTRTSNASMLDHLLSMLVFVICLLEFVSLRSFGTATFFLILLITFVDVVAGFTVGIRTARRDIEIDR